MRSVCSNSLQRSKVPGSRRLQSLCVSANRKRRRSMQTPTAIVQAWQAAANQQDIDRLLALSDANIEIVGPRGSGYGHQLLRDWIARAGLQLTTLRTFTCAQTVVPDQHS